jgi:hypothetical protein
MEKHQLRIRQEGVPMKTALALLLAMIVATSATAADPKDYQVTGPISDLTDDVITVEKGKEKWEIGRGKDTKVTGELKKGNKVTVHYKMKATNIEAKDAGKAAGKSKAK